MYIFCYLCVNQKTAYVVRFSYVSSDVCSSDLITLLRDYRAVPAGAVRRLAERRIAELEAQQGYVLGRQARRQISEDTAARLTPGTPVQRTQIHAVLDRRAGLLLIDTA